MRRRSLLLAAPVAASAAASALLGGCSWLKPRTDASPSASDSSTGSNLPPSEKALPTAFSAEPLWSGSSFSGVSIRAMRGQYLAIEFTRPTPEIHDLGPTGYVGVADGTAWVLTVDPATGEFSTFTTTLPFPRTGPAELDSVGAPGTNMAVVAYELDEEHVYALALRYEISQATDADSQDDPEPLRSDGKLDLLKIRLSDGSIVGDLAFSEQAPATDLGTENQLLWMRNGCLFAFNANIDMKNYVAAAIDPKTMTISFDAHTVFGEEKPNALHPFGAESIASFPLEPDIDRHIAHMSDGSPITIPDDQILITIFEDWAYTLNKYDDTSPDEDIISVLNLNTGESAALTEDLPQNELKFDLKDAKLIDGLILTKTLDNSGRDVRRLGDPGTVLSEKTLADRGVMAITVYGGLIWGHVAEDSAGSDSSTDTADSADSAGGPGDAVAKEVKELICWDADSGAEAGAVPFDPQDALLGVNAYGCYNEFQFYPATAWAEDIDEWKEQMG